MHGWIFTSILVDQIPKIGWDIRLGLLDYDVMWNIMEFYLKIDWRDNKSLSVPFISCYTYISAKNK